MKNKILFIMLAVALTAGMLFVSCKDPQQVIDDQTKVDLKGTWVNVREQYNSIFETIYTFNDDTYECQEKSTEKSDSSQFYTSKRKGTYTFSNSLLTMTQTHLWGDASDGLEPRWYSKAEVKAYQKQYYESQGYGWDADDEKYFEAYYAPKK